MKKKVTIIVCSALLIVSLMIGGTVAYLSDKASATNTFTIGDIDIDLTEPHWDDITDGKDILPGSTSVKDPVVEAVEGDSYMRIKMTVTDAANNAITDAATLGYIFDAICYDDTYVVDGTVGTAVVEGTGYTKAAIDALPDYNTTDFTYDTTRTANANIRYYNYTANSGIFAESTKAVLFTNIAIPTDYTSTEMTALGTGYKIVLEAQAIQSTGIASAADAYTALDA
ncbi:MAG: hypothetical protein GX051_03930 [Clostridiales bacterium]|nr:hypothetical protein [Clostridiales bacterium]